MASIEKRQRSGRTRWYARYRDPAGEQRVKVFDRRVDAERYLTTVESAKLVGSYVDPALARLTVGEWTERWLAGQAHLKASTLERYAGIVRRHVTPTWGRVRLADVSHAEVQRWVTRLAAQHEPATARKIHRVLSLILDLAVRDGRLARNPAANIRLPRPVGRERRYLTHRQVDRLATACGRPAVVSKHRRLSERENDAYRLVVLFLAYTGVRFGEMAALKVGRLDLQRRRAVIAESVTTVHRAGQVWGTPKGHTRREVPIPQFLVEELAQHVAGKGDGELVFTGVRGGGALRTTVFRRAAFDDAAAAIGLEGLNPHELRHTAASLAIAAGADVKVVQQMLGHASAAMTLDQYGHLFGDRLDHVAAAMDAARAAAVYPLCTAADSDADGESTEEGKGPVDQAFRAVPPAGFEPAHPPPEGGALSPELRGLVSVGQQRNYQPGGGVRTAVRHGAGSGVPPRSASSWAIVCTSAVCVSAIDSASVRTEGSWACWAAYCAIFRPPWWCRIISRRNSTSQALPDSDRRWAISAFVAIPGIRVPGPSSAIVMPAMSGMLLLAGMPPIQYIGDRPERLGSPHSASQPCIRPTWLVCVAEMSNASERMIGSWLWSGARLAISMPCRWWRDMSQANPASTESASGVVVRPMPRATAAPPPSSSSPTAMTAIRAVRGHRGAGRVAVGCSGVRVSAGALMAGPRVGVRDQGAVLLPALGEVGMSEEPTASLCWPTVSGWALKSGFSQLAPISG